MLMRDCLIDMFRDEFAHERVADILRDFEVPTSGESILACKACYLRGFQDALRLMAS